MEASVLPRYFNHSSFASLRRQLNYFSFVRLGKGRQRESAYINDGVVVLDDILNLKRRSSGSPPPTASGPGVAATLAAQAAQYKQLDEQMAQQQQQQQQQRKKKSNSSPNKRPSILEGYRGPNAEASRRHSISEDPIFEGEVYDAPTVVVEQRPAKRARLGKKKKGQKKSKAAAATDASLPRSASPVSSIGPFVSEDEHSSYSSTSFPVKGRGSLPLKKRPSLVSLDLSQAEANDQDLLAGCAALLGLSTGQRAIV